MAAQRSSHTQAWRLAASMLGALTVSTVALPSTQVLAQEDAYSVAMQRAQQEYRARHYEEARSFYRQAYRESINPRVLRGIAMSSYELRDYVEAYRTMHAALAMGASEADLTASERTAGTQLLARATALIGIITQVPLDATVTIDAVDTPVEPDGSLLFPLGTHHLVVTYADGRVADLDFDVVGSENVALPEPAFDVEALRTRARAAYDAGNYEASATGYEQAATTAGNDPGLWAAVGTSRLALHQPERAVEAYRRAIELAPDNAGFHAALGRAYWDAGNTPGARSEYERALALDPRNQEARAGLQRMQPATPVEEPVEAPPDVHTPPRGPVHVEVPQQRTPPEQDPFDAHPVHVEEDDGGTRFRFHLFGMGSVGSFESNGGHLAAGGGGGLAGLAQLGSVYAIGLQAAVNYVTLAEFESLADSPYWLQTDVLLWNELRFGPVGINLGLGLAIGTREASTFENGLRNVGIRVDPAFALAADARIYFADDLLFVAAGGRFAFGDFGGLAGTLAFGVEPVR